MQNNKYFLFVFILFLTGCSNPAEQNSNQVVSEGTVNYYIAPPAVGGETDPTGYIIANAKWLSGEPKYLHGRVYITDGELSAYVSKRVRVTGTIDSLTAGGVETPERKFPLIKAVSIEEIK
ncbi:MAG: hypothetical protein Q8L88_00980 [Bacteroidota bacterium]|nr:hypothetical protein [Bacteroidota bacterium]